MLKSKHQPFLSLLLLLLLAFPSTTGALSFHDTQNHWAEAYINTLHDQCGITGFKDSNGNLLYEFRPDAYLTRAEFAQMLIQCRGESIEAEQESNIYYTDVARIDWFFPSVTRGTRLGWWKGYNDQTFHPHQYIIRPEGLKMALLSKLTEDDITGGDINFKDVSAADWFFKYVAFSYSKGYINGYSDGTFGKNRFMTRAEAAKIIDIIYGYQVAATTPETSPAPTPENSPSPMIAGCTIFPSNNPWNTDISKYPVHTNSRNFINSILDGRENLHPDFGGNGEYGIPFTIVDATTPKVQLTIDYDDESDPGPYPIPNNVDIEGGGDRHIILIDKDSCKLYETWNSVKAGNGWDVGSAAIFDLKSNTLRPDGWTSADAAGLPILPGLVRYDEVKSGSINHALRFTVSESQKGYIKPATHYASSSTDPNLPPMGLRLRLKADFDLSGYTGDTRVILEALKKYGMIVADNGSDWFISGQKDPRWNDDDLRQLKNVPGSAFEVVDTGPIIK